MDCFTRIRTWSLYGTSVPLIVLVGIFTVGLVSSKTTYAQRGTDVTRLTLGHVVTERGANPVGEINQNSLPAGTQVAVLDTLAGSNSKPHRLSSLGLSRGELADRLSGASVETLESGGRTSGEYSKTSDSGRITYVLARAPDGALYESYVNAGQDGYQPGFDAIMSGEMTMGRVPEPERGSMGGAIEQAIAQEDQDQGEESDSRTANKKNATETGAEGEGSSDETSWWWIIAGTLGVVLGGGGAWIWRGREVKKWRGKAGKYKRDYTSLLNEKEKEKKKPFAISRSDTNDSDIQRLREERNKLQKRLEQEQRKTDQLLNRLRKAQSEAPSPESSSQDRSDREQRSSSLRDRQAEKLGKAFVQWCQKAGAAMVDHHGMFANQLEEVLPRAELQPIFREKNASGIVFTEDAQDPVEYWLVQVEGQDLLLPQPHKPGFREISDCFEGENISLDQLQYVEPAELQSRGRKRVLKEKGRIT